LRFGIDEIRALVDHCNSIQRPCPALPHKMTAKKPVPGILWVNSDVIKLDQLSREDFDTWYSDEHIPDVVATSGVPSASRYQHMADGSTPARRLGFLTIYKMPDINFIETKEFRNLEGQSPGPNRERIFQNAEFDTRVYELVQSDEGKGAASSGKKYPLSVHYQGP
jgi:hypothetical protein